jgi:hypothetical protein
MGETGACGVQGWRDGGPGRRGASRRPAPPGFRGGRRGRGAAVPARRGDPAGPGIDTCCGGRLTPSHAAASAGVAVETVRETLGAGRGDAT